MLAPRVRTRLTPPLTLRGYCLAAAATAVWVAATRGGHTATRGQPVEKGEQMGVDEECAALAREIRACDVRLGLLASDEPRNELFRQELQQRRHGAAQRLAQLEGNHRSSNE